MSQTTKPHPAPDELPTNERFVRLESHVAELERLVEELNQVVIEQGKMLRKLQQQQQQVASTVETMELDRIRSNVQKPPHSVL